MLGIGLITATTSSGPPLLGANPPSYTKGQASVVIVETASLQNGVVRDGKGGLVADGTPKSKSPEKSQHRKAHAKQRSDGLIVIDLP